jgi:hypothetical protein
LIRSKVEALAALIRSKGLSAEALAAQSVIQHYSSILEDETLAERGLPITDAETGEVYDLAIPVGGKRRSGYLECPLSEKGAQLLIERMRTVPGFPNARIEANSQHVVWGEPIFGHGRAEASTVMITKRGHQFGYKESAIRAFVKASKRRGGIERMFRGFAEVHLALLKLQG